MTKNTPKQEKAVDKIRKAIKKAVEKGVSAKRVSATVEDAMKDATGDETGKAEVATSAAAKAAKMPGLNKSTDVTFKRGVTAPGKPALNMKPLIHDSEKPSLKKLPGKRKPPAVTQKRVKSK